MFLVQLMHLTFGLDTSREVGTKRQMRSTRDTYGVWQHGRASAGNFAARGGGNRPDP
jgi:hypothetical protein